MLSTEGAVDADNCLCVCGWIQNGLTPCVHTLRHVQPIWKTSFGAGTGHIFSALHFLRGWGMAQLLTHCCCCRGAHLRTIWLHFQGVQNPLLTSTSTEHTHAHTHIQTTFIHIKVNKKFLRHRYLIYLKENSLLEGCRADPYWVCAVLECVRCQVPTLTFTRTVCWLHR